MTTPSPSAAAQAPETLEGWYALHQLFSIDRAALRAFSDAERRAAREEAQWALDALTERRADDGWTAIVSLVGSRADVMFLHLRPTLDQIAESQRALSRIPLLDALRPVYSFLSVTEAGMYGLTAKLAKEAAARGGKVGDEQYQRMLRERLDAELASDHVQKRLYPSLPPEMPWVCFYPMNKKRQPSANWYAQPLEERSRMMWEHGLSGRKYSGRILQIVTGAIGFDAWEWGVTLFARDPLDFKKIVSEMRFDEASAKYGEFGDFFVGKRAGAREWLAEL